MCVCVCICIYIYIYIYIYINFFFSTSLSSFCSICSFPESGPHLLHIQVEDRNDADLYSHFATACAFLGIELLALFVIRTLVVPMCICDVSIVSGFHFNIGSAAHLSHQYRRDTP